MGMVLYVLAIEPTTIDSWIANGDEDAMFESLTTKGWEADKMWWAALDLALGPGAIETLGGIAITDEVAYTPIIRAAHADVSALVNRCADVDIDQLQTRFDNGVFGQPLGPEPVAADREWLTQASLTLIELLRDAESSSNELLYIIA